MAPSSSKSPSSSPPLPPQPSPQFAPIRESRNEGHEEERCQTRTATPGGDSSSADVGATPKHRPTPLPGGGKPSYRKRPEDVDDGGVSCSKCRPKEKTWVVPLDSNGGLSRTILSPNNIFKSIVTSLTRRSPKPSDTPSAAREEQWKVAVAELTHKLMHATRKRDEALLQVSRLKHSVTELEKKLNKLEIYCHDLKSGLDECSGSSPYRAAKNPVGARDGLVEDFVVAVSEARAAVRLLSRSLTVQLRHVGGKVYERITVLLQPYDIRMNAFSKNSRSLLFYLEALLNRVFFQDFESVGFEKNGSSPILNPAERCEANLASFKVLRPLTWEEVLDKGTRHFSEQFSRFCDRKMSEIVAMLGWNRAWPEPLLQAFFGASKSVWLVHLLAASVHPSLPIFRVDKGANFDSVYMEDAGGDKSRTLVPTVVRIMIAPGFYVFGSVVKSKVLCRYYTNTNTHHHKGLIASP